MRVACQKIMVFFLFLFLFLFPIVTSVRERDSVKYILYSTRVVPYGVDLYFYYIYILRFALGTLRRGAHRGCRRGVG